MYLTKLVSITGGALIGAGLLSVGDLAIPTYRPIEVHSLKYNNGIVQQERTITTEAEYFPAQWQAAVYSMETGLPVPFCEGGGFWNYSAGHAVANIPLDEWSGSEACTAEALRELGGSFQPVASWHWGDEFTLHKGEVFKP